MVKKGKGERSCEELNFSQTPQQEADYLNVRSLRLICHSFMNERGYSVPTRLRHRQRTEVQEDPEQRRIGKGEGG